MRDAKKNATTDENFCYDCGCEIGDDFGLCLECDEAEMNDHTEDCDE